MGVVPPRPGYLEGLREITSRNGILLIFDEVITGFRLALGGAQERYRIAPDLTTLGKILGGGLPIGAYGGGGGDMERGGPPRGGYQGGGARRDPPGGGARPASPHKLETRRAEQGARAPCPGGGGDRPRPKSS